MEIEREMEMGREREIEMERKEIMRGTDEELEISSYKFIIFNLTYADMH